MSPVSENLDDYKLKVIPEIRARLEWQRELIFTATTQRGYDMDFDAEVQWGCMPTEGVVLSLAGCMAIDVVAILEKMRAKPSTFSMEIVAERSPTPPQRLRKVRMDLHLGGEKVTMEKVQRAVDLSQEKYCSVTHSLREDIEISTVIHLEPPPTEQ